jgi:hypothetical protein
MHVGVVADRACFGGDSESGRGLMMVAGLTGGRWGWQKSPRGHGKVVWAELSADTA